MQPMPVIGMSLDMLYQLSDLVQLLPSAELMIAYAETRHTVTMALVWSRPR